MPMLKNQPLAPHSTMRLGGNALFLQDIITKEQIPIAINFAKKNNIPVIMIGGGSNIVWSDKGYNGLVLVNKIKGLKISEHDKDAVYLQVGAGEIWDDAVKQAVKHKLHGIEALSLIPGTAGATPVQNVGAYGQDVSQTLVSVEAYDAILGDIIIIPAEDCDFGYRTSRFNTKDRGRFFITSLIFGLQRKNPKAPFYGALQNYFKEHKIDTYTPAVLRDAVIAIRQSKLPDPSKVANNGSFFANPIISKKIFSKIIDKYPDITYWPMPNETFKLSAAWILEKAGYKNFHDRHTGMATWPAQPLVLVNENAKSTADLLIFRNRIVSDVEHKFGITLKQEPELI